MSGMRERSLAGVRGFERALVRQSARAMRAFTVCLLAQSLAGCGKRSHDDVRSNTSSWSELVLLDALGQPVAQTQALIAGRVVMTDDSGHAELDELPASYDAIVANGHDVRAFLGLTTRSPTIALSNTYLSLGNERATYVYIANSTPATNQYVYEVAGVTGGPSFNLLPSKPRRFTLI